MAGISSSAAGAAPPSPPPEPPTAEGHGGAADAVAADDNNNTVFPLLDLLERFPDLFALKVLAHLDPIDRTFLGQAGGACRAAVAASDLPRAGTRRVEVLGRTRATTRRVVLWVVTHRLNAFVESVERLAWAKASGCPWVERTCAVVAQSGRIEVLRWAREQDCPWGAGTCCYAALNGHLELLQWAREHGCPWCAATCATAACGHLEVLKWAREHDCPWDARTCQSAALNGHLEVLQWARENGCPWSKRDCLRVRFSRQHLETLAWVQAQPE
jgi:hypothetical protein